MSARYRQIAIACANFKHMDKTAFKDFFDGLSAAEKQRLADRAETSIAYLYQISNGHRRAGADLIGRLMAADKRITFKMVRTQRPN